MRDRKKRAFRKQDPRKNRHYKNPSLEKRYNEYLKQDKYKERIQDRHEERENRKKEYYAEMRASGGNFTPLDFGAELRDKDNLYLIAEIDKEKKVNRNKLLKKALVTLACVVLAVVLNILSFPFPFTPKIIKINFSAFPELLAALTVNPLAGIVVVLLNNLFYTMIIPGSVANAPNKIILDILYLLVSWALFRFIINYRTEKNTKLPTNPDEEDKFVQKDYSMSSLLITSVFSSLITALVSIFTFQRFTLPLLYKFGAQQGYSSASVLETYQHAFGDLTSFAPFIQKIVPYPTSLTMCTLIYNFPLNIFKYFVCGAITSLIYIYVYDFTQKE